MEQFAASAQVAARCRRSAQRASSLAVLDRQVHHLSRGARRDWASGSTSCAGSSSFTAEASSEGEGRGSEFVVELPLAPG